MTAVRARIWSTLVAWCLGGLAALASTASHAAPQNGWWWNPAESGRGFFLEVQGPRMFMAGYFYADDGRPTWLVSNDPMPDPDSYDGRLLAVSQGQSLLGEYRHPSAAVDAGAVSLRFSDSTHGTLTWPGGTVPIERQIFQHGSTGTLQPRVGWWWNPDQSGRGFSIELQGDHMFIGAYMYDDAGNATWYVADALMSSPTHFTGPLYRFANGQTLGGPYHAPGAPAVIGAITIDFSAPDRAIVTLSDDAPKSGPKSDTSFAIETQYQAPAVPAAPHLLVGNVDFYSDSIGDAGAVVTFHVEIASMTWVKDDEVVGLDGGYPAFYNVAAGFAVADIQLSSPVCQLTGAGSVNVTTGSLTLNKDGSYRGNLSQEVPVHTTTRCTGGDGQVVERQDDVSYPFSVTFAGQSTSGVLEGSTNLTTAASRLDWNWKFQPGS
jgi:hypothetical protein